MNFIENYFSKVDQTFYFFPLRKFIAEGFFVKGYNIVLFSTNQTAHVLKISNKSTYLNIIYLYLNIIYISLIEEFLTFVFNLFAVLSVISLFIHCSIPNSWAWTWSEIFHYSVGTLKKSIWIGSRDVNNTLSNIYGRAIFVKIVNNLWSILRT